MIDISQLPAVRALYPASEPEPMPMQVATLADQVEYARAPVGSGWFAGRADIHSAARLVTAPVGLPVLLSAAITAARADGAGLDAEIELDVRGIASKVEHELQRALIEQTWVVELDALPLAIKLRMAAPLIAIEHVNFYDADGALRTLDPQDYMVPKSTVPAHVMPAPGRRWPDTAVRADAVEVRYRCGYGADHTAVPPEIQSYILGKITEKHAPGESRNAKFLDGLLDGKVVYG